MHARAESKALPDLIDDYRDYSPPSWMRSTVIRLLESLEPNHIGGLQVIVLTNADRLGKGKTNRVRGRKYRERDCRGFYHPASRNGGAWIQLVVDNIVRNRKPRFKFMQDFIVGRTLFHEIGHHLHETVGSAKRGGEESADDWGIRLMDVHVRRRHRLLMMFVKAFSFVLEPIATRLIAARRAKAG